MKVIPTKLKVKFFTCTCFDLKNVEKVRRNIILLTVLNYMRLIQTWKSSFKVTDVFSNYGAVSAIEVSFISSNGFFKVSKNYI